MSARRCGQTGAEMKIRNFLEAGLKEERIHEGSGLCRHAVVFEGEEIDAPVRFINYTVIPPRGSFGMHRHGNDNEFYVVLSGRGIYRQGDEEREVKKGDIMMNAPFETHGLNNTGECDMELLVFEVVIRE